MLEYSENLEFEKAIECREKNRNIKKINSWSVNRIW